MLHTNANAYANTNTYHVDLRQLPLKHGLLKGGQRPHDGVVLGHDGLQTCGGDTQLEGVGVANQFLGGRRQASVEGRLPDVAHFTQQQQELGVKVDMDDLWALLCFFVVLFSDLGDSK